MSADFTTTFRRQDPIHSQPPVTGNGPVNRHRTHRDGAVDNAARDSLSKSSADLSKSFSTRSNDQTKIPVCKITRNAVSNDQYTSMRKESNIGSGKKVKFDSMDEMASVDFGRETPVKASKVPAKPPGRELSEKDKMLAGSKMPSLNDPSITNIFDETATKMDEVDEKAAWIQRNSQERIDQPEADSPSSCWQRLLDSIWNCFCCCFGRRGDE